MKQGGGGSEQDLLFFPENSFELGFEIRAAL
jgi:hypothetical protein